MRHTTRRSSAQAGAGSAAQLTAPCRLALLLLLALGGAVGCVASDAAPGGRSEAVVYGSDDRQDVYAHPSAPLRAIAHESIVALMGQSRLVQQGDGSFELAPVLTLGEAYNLCPDQRFVSQPAVAFCSGTLVAPDIVVTAGHCITTLSGCLNTRLVFDYLYTADGVPAPLEADDVYTCAEVLARQDGVLDYAYLRLDRPVVGHAAAALAPGLGTTCRNVVANEDVAVLGFGSGIPLKIDSGGAVTNPSTRGTFFFSTSLDTFGGNSGSGVFNQDNELVGVLSSGASDYVARADAGCDEVNVRPEASGVEHIGHLLPTLLSYCETASAPSAALCSHAAAGCGTGPVDAGVPDAGGGTDAGVVDDAGVADDAGPRADSSLLGDVGVQVDSSGVDQGTPGRRRRGRGCAVSGPEPRGPGAGALGSLGTLSLLGLVALRRRRR
jgi:hypothetical protein